MSTAEPALTFEHLSDITPGTWVTATRTDPDTKNTDNLYSVLVLETRQRNPKNQFISFLVFDPTGNKTRLLSGRDIVELGPSVEVPDPKARLRLLQSLVTEGAWIEHEPTDLGDDDDDDDDLESLDGTWYDLVASNGEDVCHITDSERQLLIKEFDLELITVKELGESYYSKCWVMRGSEREKLAGFWTYPDSETQKASKCLEEDDEF